MDSAILTAILTAIRQFKAAHGYTPRIVQIAARAHVSPSSAWRGVRELARQDCIEIASRPRARLTIIVKEPPCDDQLVAPRRHDSAA